VYCYNRCHGNAVKEFLVLCYNIYEYVYCYNRCHGNAVKEFLVLWDNIYDCVFTILDFSIILDGQFTNRVFHNNWWFLMILLLSSCYIY
jgi:hypothetical protein